MEQLKLFLERANQDNELAEKLTALGGAFDNDSVIALAAEHGFTVTAEDIKQFKKSGCNGCGGNKLNEEELNKVAGGGFGVDGPEGHSTKNRYNPEVCKGLTSVRSDASCNGNNFLFFGVWCDHYRRAKYGAHTGNPYWAHECVMGAFPRYHGSEYAKPHSY